MERPEFTYRLKYERGESVRFVSHLDLVKVFERALRRASVDVLYSEGFNPRMLLVFGNPLPVGFTSSSEFVDIKTGTCYECSDLIGKLNDHLPGDIKIVSGSILVKPYDSIVSSIRFNKYHVYTDASPEAAAVLLRDHETSETIETVKRSKSGPKTVDIKKMIRYFGYEGDGLFIIETSGTQENNLRPDLALRTFAERNALEIRMLHIHKIDSMP